MFVYFSGWTNYTGTASFKANSRFTSTLFSRYEAWRFWTGNQHESFVINACHFVSVELLLDLILSWHRSPRRIDGLYFEAKCRNLRSDENWAQKLRTCHVPIESVSWWHCSSTGCLQSCHSSLFRSWFGKFWLNRMEHTNSSPVLLLKITLSLF